MLIVDALRLKLEENVLQGKPSPLNLARGKYGTDPDISRLLEEAKGVSEIAASDGYYFVDLTPFDRVGHVGRLISDLGSIPGPMPVLLLMSRLVIDQLRQELGDMPLLTALFDQTGNLSLIVGGHHVDASISSDVSKRLAGGDEYYPDLVAFRRQIANEQLTSLLFEYSALEVPDENDPPSERVYMEEDGRHYRVMPNNMLVSSYLNLKRLGRSPQALMRIAYEVVLDLQDYFRRDKDPLNEFDLLLSPNNTSLFISSLVQAIVEKPLVAVDRLGPIPALQLQSGRLRDVLEERRVIVIEEVVATGNEVDRTIMFLNHMKANLQRIIAVYHLEVGIPLLPSENQFAALCTPKAKLNYVYRSR